MAHLCNPENGIKYLIYIQNWPFMNIRNRLQIRMQTDGFSHNPSSACSTSENSTDGSTNLQWFKLNFDGVSLYATFAQDTEVDGKYGKVSFSLSGNDIVISLPSFWEYAVVDPVYSVLLDTQIEQIGECDFGKIRKNRNLKKIVGVAVGGVVGVTVIIAVGILLFKIWHQKQWQKKFKKVYS
eukprot:Phypoly_transcript_21771.p1 GENE.Phypoly_transcript_21771~~Phypoly_transcript_21771.p1  ORF type:complete len:182 (+),score=17.75 Phypoly_transcript_21771:90-635(+)